MSLFGSIHLGANTLRAMQIGLQVTGNNIANTITGAGGAPGVVALACDRSGNIYEGAAGVRELGGKVA